jgi:hypothetical protein
MKPKLTRMGDIDAFTAALIGSIDGFTGATITIATVIATTIDRVFL